MIKMALRFAATTGLVWLSGCSGAPLPSLGAETGSSMPGGVVSLASVTSYGSANAIITTGYSDREIAPDHFEVRVKGSTVTPPERLEKIALARAAEIGTTQRFKFFKTGAFAHDVSCKNAKQVSSKAGQVGRERAPIVAVDVVYAQQALDAGYLPSAETFERLSAEIASQAVSGEAKAAAAAAVENKCGK